jgi:DNA-directed RNA polymerase subunit RPC12/RpoP
MFDSDPSGDYTKLTMISQNQTRRKDFNRQHFEQLVQAGIAAVKGGDFEQARNLLEKAVGMDSTDARPWLWLSATTKDPSAQRDYLEYALAADPNNGAARRGLVLLSDKLDRDRLLAEGEGVKPQEPGEPLEAKTGAAYLCQQCGGHMQFDPLVQSLRCQYCGYTAQAKPVRINGDAGQSLDYVLPTSRGHQWAQAQHQLACGRCGAISLLPPGETVHECPYCGSNSLLESSEQHELIDPQAVGLMRINREQANQILQTWLGNGFFIPDNLKKFARKSQLRPAYYAFWAITGMLEIQWNCDINLGTSRSPNWIPQSGYEFENFDNVLIPGQKAIDLSQLGEILPFLLDDVVEFKPEYLAGWTAMTYDRSLADASLEARERVVQKVRRELSSRVELGREKRNLRTGATNWSGMTYKYLLLPIWTGSYVYQGKQYRILINGQTGKISGVKPTDRLKAGAVIASGFLTILAMVLVFFFIAFSLGWIP